MTDLLATRTARLVDRAAPGDWANVQYRARRQTQKIAYPIVVAVAAFVVAGAIAATGGWVFHTDKNVSVANSQVEFQGERYAVTVFATYGRSFDLLLSRGNQATPSNQVMHASGGSVLDAPSLPQPLLPHITPTGPAFGALYYARDGGQIWFGDSRTSIATIKITDTQGRIYTTDTVTPPSNVKLAFKFWIIALPHATGNTIAGYDNNGKLIQRHSVWGLGRALYLH